MPANRLPPPVIGECDVCCNRNRLLHFRIAYGIETYACDECCGDDPDEDEQERRQQP